MSQWVVTMAWKVALRIHVGASIRSVQSASRRCPGVARPVADLPAPYRRRQCLDSRAPRTTTARVGCEASLQVPSQDWLGEILAEYLW